jgi:hypothetical protein
MPRHQPTPKFNVIARMNLSPDFTNTSYRKVTIQLRNTGPDIELILKTAGEKNSILWLERDEAIKFNELLTQVITDTIYLTDKEITAHD